MVKCDVVPCISFNGIKFGTDRRQVRSTMGTSFSEFKKTKTSKNTTDNFGFCHIYYDADNKFEAVEIFNDAEIYAGEKKIYPGEVKHIVDAFPDMIQEGDDYTSIESSVGFSVMDGKIDSILFGNSGYYG